MTDFLLTMSFILFTNQKVPLGSHTATEALFPLFVAVLEGFCWNTFQLVGYAVLDIIQSTKMAPFQVVCVPGEEKEVIETYPANRGLRNHRKAFFLPKIN
jgi:hypothetical protein